MPQSDPEKRLQAWARMFKVPQFENLASHDPRAWLEKHYPLASEDERQTIHFLLGMWGDDLDHLNKFNLREAWSIWDEGQKKGFLQVLKDIDKNSLP